MSDRLTPAPRARLLIRRYLPLVGGMERQADQLCRGLIDRGLRVEVWTRRILSDTPSDEIRQGYRIRRLRPGGTGRAGEYGSLPVWIVRLVADRSRYDVLLVFGGGWLALAAAFAARRSGRPWLYRPATAGDLTRFLDPEAVPAGGAVRKWLRGNIPPSAWRAARLRQAAAAVAISAEIRAELLRWGFDPSQIHDIPNGVDTARFAPVSPEKRRALRAALGMPPEAPVALFLGRLVRRKGVLELAQAWKQLMERGELADGAQLVLAGSGVGQQDSVESSLRELTGNLPSIRMPGPVDRPEDWLAACNLFCLPSHYEGLSNALLEAMASGRAILMSDLPPNLAAAPAPACAISHPAGDIGALARALSRLLADRASRQQLGRAARERALAQHDLAGATDRWAALIAALASDKARSTA